MPRQLDEEWLLKEAATEADRQTLRDILALRADTIRNNTFSVDEEIFNLKMDGKLLSIRQCAAPSSIEVYHEIFREDNHFLHGDFSPLDLRFVMDIGANEGFYALRVAMENPAALVLCVEPSPYAFEILTMNINKNSLTNIIALNAAASSDSKSIDMEFVRQINSIGGARLRDVSRPWLPESVIEKRTVQSFSIAQLSHQYDFPRIDILKIDVEGMEDEIIDSIAHMSDMIQRIVVERHSRELRDKVVETLTPLGFELVYEEDKEFKQYYGDLYFINQKTGGTA
jgi:FkbM family methyltransferase